METFQEEVGCQQGWMIELEHKNIRHYSCLSVPFSRVAPETTLNVNFVRLFVLMKVIIEYIIE